MPPRWGFDGKKNGSFLVLYQPAGLRILLQKALRTQPIANPSNHPPESKARLERFLVTMYLEVDSSAQR
jgi:hypothetical protein